MKVTGRCHCGSITYEGEADPANVSVCHCTDCQMISGTAYRTSVPVPADRFRLLTGTPRTYIKTAESGNRRQQAFCGDCGSPVYSAAEKDTPTYSLRIGCLDQREELPPVRQIWCQSRLDWASDLRDVPAVERQ